MEPNASPFRRGERQIQERLGVGDRLADLGRRVIRDYMPDQHREFYEHLPFLLIDTIDGIGRPWASVLSGPPGFVNSPDPHTLRINALPVHGDPLNENLVPEVDVGILGIQFRGRRRNRLNGRIVAAAEGEIEVRVVQTFGNCPQYIQERDFELSSAIDRVDEELPVERLVRLGESERAIIGRADNFYIASQFSEGRHDASHGVDVSHRGGRPGFILIDDDRTLVWPDFAGNFHFNTLGNILLNPRAGLLFIDFEDGDLLHLTGAAEIVWEGEELRAFTGAQRLVRFSMEEAIRVIGGLPIQWRFRGYSPSLEQTGSWEQVASTLAARAEGNIYRAYTVDRVEKESGNVTSFYLKPSADERIPCHKAGQFLPLELEVPGVEERVLRTYTISDAPNGSYYRLSIKREPAAKPGLPPGIASNYFHDHVTPGTTLRAMSPRGKFTLDTSSTRPIVLASAGVGITPMVSMLNQLTQDSVTCGGKRQIWFVHGTRNGAEHAFGPHVRALQQGCDTLQVHIRYSRPAKGDRLGSDYDSGGRVDVDLLKSLLPFDDYDFYLCGPRPFMEGLYSGLKSLNVPDERVHFEFFGQGGSLCRGRAPPLTSAADTRPVSISFERSGITAVWDPSKGTLLDLAEAEGLRPDYSCRSGVCQTCATRIVSGAVEYLEPPWQRHPKGKF